MFNKTELAMLKEVLLIQRIRLNNDVDGHQHWPPEIRAHKLAKIYQMTALYDKVVAMDKAADAPAGFNPDDNTKDQGYERA